jgi:hypothetical protein
VKRKRAQIQYSSGWRCCRRLLLRRLPAGASKQQKSSCSAVETPSLVTEKQFWAIESHGATDVANLIAIAKKGATRSAIDALFKAGAAHPPEFKREHPGGGSPAGGRSCGPLPPPSPARTVVLQHAPACHAR